MFIFVSFNLAVEIEYRPHYPNAMSDVEPKKKKVKKGKNNEYEEMTPMVSDNERKALFNLTVDVSNNSIILFNIFTRNNYLNINRFTGIRLLRACVRQLGRKLRILSFGWNKPKNEP